MGRAEKRIEDEAASASICIRDQVPPSGDRVSFIVHRVNGRIGQVCAPAFGRLQVDLISSRILALLHQSKKMTVGELVEAMVLPQSTISHQLQRLESRGLLRRHRSPADNRSVDVTMTAEGRRLAQQCDKLGAAVHRAIATRLSASELETLRHLLHRMYESLDQVRFD